MDKKITFIMLIVGVAVFYLMLDMASAQVKVEPLKTREIPDAPVTFTCVQDPIRFNSTCTFPDIIKNVTKEMQEAVRLVKNSTALKLLTAGTDYLPADNGTIFARVLDANSRPINLASCNGTAYYPNKTSYLFSNAPLTFLEKGIYYKDFTVPNEVGNYITVFDCLVPSNVFAQNQTLSLNLVSTFGEDFPFDNSNNLTINKAYLNISYDQNPVGQFRLDFNGVSVFTSTIGVDGVTNIDLIPSNFTLAENQAYLLTNLAGVITVNWIRLFVNYTAIEPQQIIRGQDEINVRTDFSKIRDVIQNNMANNFTATNGLINSHDSRMGANFTNTNSLITSVNSTVNSFRTFVEGQFSSLISLLTSRFDQSDAGVAGNASVTNSLVNGLQGSINAHDTRMGTNFTNTNGLIVSVNNSVNSISVNTTPILNALDSHDTRMGNNFTNTNGLISTHDSNMNSQFSTTNSLIASINSTIIAQLLSTQSAIQSSINGVPANVWSYATRTLTSNVTVANFTLDQPVIRGIAKGVYDYFYLAKEID